MELEYRYCCKFEQWRWSPTTRVMMVQIYVYVVLNLAIIRVLCCHAVLFPVVQELRSQLYSWLLIKDSAPCLSWQLREQHIPRMTYSATSPPPPPPSLPRVASCPVTWCSKATVVATCTQKTPTSVSIFNQPRLVPGTRAAFLWPELCHDPVPLQQEVLEGLKTGSRQSPQWMGLCPTN